MPEIQGPRIEDDVNLGHARRFHNLNTVEYLRGRRCRSKQSSEDDRSANDDHRHNRTQAIELVRAQYMTSMRFQNSESAESRRILMKTVAV